MRVLWELLSLLQMSWSPYIMWSCRITSLLESSCLLHITISPTKEACLLMEELLRNWLMIQSPISVL